MKLGWANRATSGKMGLTWWRWCGHFPFGYATTDTRTSLFARWVAMWAVRLASLTWWRCHEVGSETAEMGLYSEYSLSLSQVAFHFLYLASLFSFLFPLFGFRLLRFLFFFLFFTFFLKDSHGLLPPG